MWKNRCNCTFPLNQYLQFHAELMLDDHQPQVVQDCLGLVGKISLVILVGLEEMQIVYIME